MDYLFSGLGMNLGDLSRLSKPFRRRRSQNCLTEMVWKLLFDR